MPGEEPVLVVGCLVGGGVAMQQVFVIATPGAVQSGRKDGCRVINSWAVQREVRRMEQVFTEFSRLMKVRLQRSVYTTEDSVRYTFFLALLNSTSLDPHEIILEYPHPQMERALIDTYISCLRGKSIAMEFKYDREIPSGSSVPRPMKAGAIFSDFLKLSRFSVDSKMDRLFVYCTDSIMSNYFRNPRNGHVEFFELPKGETLPIGLAYTDPKPVTFKRELGGTLLIDLESLWSEKLPQEHELRIYRIVPTS